ncbi:hypothetical protein D1818_15915 [Aquimarina sp. BL5]|nr:hypothetical protein D1818_15915 [Aquimarina sp. BL5]RKN09233.1 hypothetical protein D7036_04600 [Aquimarina sp. BL5]
MAQLPEFSDLTIILSIIFNYILMKNLAALSNQEITTINGGNHSSNVWDNGSGGGCTDIPGFPGPIIILGPTTGPTFPDPDVFSM